MDESTVRRRHFPKLQGLKYLDKRMIPSRQGQRCLWFLTSVLAGGYFGTKRATLPRWAALMLPEWSHRAVYATVLQRSLATSRGSRKGPVEVGLDDVLWGGYGRHNFSIGHLCKLTGLTRKSVVDAKRYLLHHDWLTWDEGAGRGEELFIHDALIIPADVLQRAHQTTRSMMFSKRKGA